MDVSFYSFGVILIFSVGLGVCGDPQNITFLNPKEFDVDDLLNDPLVIEALESNETNNEERSSSHEPSEKEIIPTLKRERNPQTIPRLTCLGIAYKGDKRIPESFESLQPANVNPNNLSLSELEMKFYEQGSKHPWRELKQYPTSEYRRYWAHVCDYFWVKKNRDELYNRACYVNQLLFSENVYGLIKYQFIQQPKTRAEILRCTCYYYLRDRSKRVSSSVVFAVHKYSDTEYYILTKIKKARITYSISDFWAEIMLPIPLR